MRGSPPAERERGRAGDGTFRGALPTPPGTPTSDYLQVMHVVPGRAAMPPSHPVNSEKKPIDLFFKVEKLHLPACLAEPGARPGTEGWEVWRITFRFYRDEVVGLHQPCGVQGPVLSWLVTQLCWECQPWRAPLCEQETRGLESRSKAWERGFLSLFTYTQVWGPGVGYVA